MRMMVPAGLVMLGLLLAGGTPAGAQTCLGRASFGTGRLQAAGAGAFTSGQQYYELAGGAATGRFFGFAAARTYSLSRLDKSAFGLAASGGMALPPQWGGRLHICPLATLAARLGPAFEDVVPLDSRGIRFTAGAQVAIGGGGRVRRWIPAIGAAVARTRETLSAPDLLDETTTETFGIINAGVGFLLTDRVAAVPSVNFPIGVTGAHPELVVSIAVSFGAR